MRKRLVSSFLASALLVSGACSGSGDGGRTGAAADTSPLALLMASAADKVAAARTYRFEGTVVYPVGDGMFDVTLTGAADAGSGDAVGEAEIEPFTTMELDLSRAPLAAARGGRTPIILDGTTAYLRFPEGPQPGTGLGPGGKLWAKVDLASPGGSTEGFRLLLDRARGAGPDRFLALMTRARAVVEVGTEKIRDVDTRHFTMQVAVEEVADNAPAAFASGAQGLLATLGAVTISVDVWLGPDDLPRRVSYAVDRSLTPDLVSATIDLFDYGTAIERTLPPDTEIFDFTGLTETEG